MSLSFENLSVEKVKHLFKQLFRYACENITIEPDFNEAAEGEGDSGGVKWHGWAPIGLPGAKFHAMTGQVEKSHDIRRARAAGRSFRDQVINRPDYYGNFVKFNNFKM